jgi:hypothetical protein
MAKAFRVPRNTIHHKNKGMKKGNDSPGLEQQGKSRLNTSVFTFT